MLTSSFFLCLIYFFLFCTAKLQLINEINGSGCFKYSIYTERDRQTDRDRLYSAWAGTHLSKPCLAVHGSGWLCSGSAGSRLRWALTGNLEPQRVVLSGFNPPWRGYVYRLVPEAPLFRRMPMGPEAFLEPPSVSGPPKKALCHTRPVGGTYDKYRQRLADSFSQHAKGQWIGSTNKIKFK